MNWIIVLAAIVGYVVKTNESYKLRKRVRALERSNKLKQVKLEFLQGDMTTRRSYIDNRV